VGINSVISEDKAGTSTPIPKPTKQRIINKCQKDSTKGARTEKIQTTKTQKIEGFFLPNLFDKYPEIKLPKKNPKKIPELKSDLSIVEIFQSL